MFSQSAVTNDDDSHIDPVVKMLFDPNTDLQKDIPHLKYLESLNNDAIVDQIATKLREKHQ